jgi:hypothetical protein
MGEHDLKLAALETENGALRAALDEAIEGRLFHEDRAARFVSSIESVKAERDAAIARSERLLNTNEKHLARVAELEGERDFWKEQFRSARSQIDGCSHATPLGEDCYGCDGPQEPES